MYKVNKELLKADAKKIPGILFAFIFCAYGLCQMKNVGIGMSSWATLNLGITKITHLKYGQVSQLIGIVIICFSVFLKIYPGIGTLLNMFFIGLYVDVIDKFNIVLVSDNIVLQVIFFTWGLVIFSFGIYFYLSFELGAGPRDGLMVGLVKLTGWNVKFVKPAIETTVLIIGLFLGSEFGLGTIIGILFGGVILNKVFMIKGFNPKETNQRKLSDYFIKAIEEEAL